MEVKVNTEYELQRERLRDISLSLILENQHQSGAFVASPTFFQYGFSWLRDGTYIAYSLLRKGYNHEVRSHIQWVADVIARYSFKVEKLPELLNSLEPQKNNWFFSARYTLEGEEDTSDWPNFQIDGYGSWLWLVAEYMKHTSRQLPADWEESAKTVITYLELVWSLPNSDCWEEFNGNIHPATLACLAGGLSSIGPHLSQTEQSRCSRLAETIKKYIMDHVHEDAYFPKYIGSDTIDASLIWLSVPYEVVPPNHPVMKRTIEKIEQEITSEGGVKRYPQDTYYGGGQWIILTAFLGWYYIQMGKTDRAEELMEWILQQQEADGFLPEQVLDQVNDPSMVKPWEERWGSVATPLLWSHAMFLILDDEISVYNQRKERKNV